LLKEVFIQLVSNYATDNRLIKQLWEEIEENYSNRKRHYHTLLHLDNLSLQLNEAKTQINEWNTILFSIFYHDVIYNALKTNNEEKSAEFAQNRMRLLEVPQTVIESSVQQILATKKHILSDDGDTNFFTDADLSILGQEWDVYSDYYKKIRKEYSLIPDIIYMPGRKNVVQRFLQMERIFKTDFFFNKFELQAKENLQRELELL
jgi:predicted metal-dependent HD superfamily phosphohydrolase